LKILEDFLSVNYLKQFSTNGRAFVGNFPILLAPKECPFSVSVAAVDIEENDNHRGCMNPLSINYDPSALTAGACTPYVECVGNQDLMWVIRETAYNLRYLSGDIAEDGTLIDLPDTYQQGSTTYPGYMELVVVCKNDLTSPTNDYSLIQWVTINTDAPVLDLTSLRKLKDFENVDETVYSPFPEDSNYNPNAILTSEAKSASHLIFNGSSTSVIQIGALEYDSTNLLSYEYAEYPNSLTPGYLEYQA
jgi:hypothetical protein